MLSFAGLLLPLLVSSIVAAFPILSRQGAGIPGKSIEYDSCPSQGSVQYIVINPCHGAGTRQDPCEFRQGENYTITLGFTTSLPATAPRANLIAYNTENGLEEQYPYSGQSFGGCSYTSCPIIANQPATYVYHFKTLASPFDALAFNMTSSLIGPSIMCARFPIDFVPQ